PTRPPSSTLCPYTTLFRSDGPGHFRRHVGLVVLGQDLGGDERAVLHVAGGDHALALAEQVRKNALVDHGHLVEAVGDHEIHLQRDRKSTRLNSSHVSISYA